ncbi:MAG: hypothetical protein WC080_03290 [Patescibacteria group bacterium]
MSAKSQKFYRIVAMANLIILILFVITLAFPAHAHAELLYQVLQGTTGPSATIKEVWESIRSMVNYVVIAALIFIAFANILQLNINTYGIKKFLPALVMAVVLANFSYLICRFIVDLSSAAMSMLINSPAGGAGIGNNDYGISGAFLTNFDKSTLVTNGALNWKQIGLFLVLTLVEFAGAIMVLVLAFFFFVRNYVLYFLVALAPLAFMASVLTLSKSVFNQWWQMFWKWTFMPVVSLFWLWVGGRWLAPLTDGDPGLSFLSILFAGVCFYLAITTPQMMGKGVMTAWNNLGKWGWNKTGGRAAKYAGDFAKEKYDNVKTRAQNRMIGYHDKKGDFQLTRLGKMMMNRKAAKQIPQDVRAKYEKEALNQRYFDLMMSGKLPKGAQGRVRAALRADSLDEQKTWQYEEVSKLAGAMEIDPETGEVATPGKNGKLFRDKKMSWAQSREYMAKYKELTRRAGNSSADGHDEALKFFNGESIDAVSKEKGRFRTDESRDPTTGALRKRNRNMDASGFSSPVGEEIEAAAQATTEAASISGASQGIRALAGAQADQVSRAAMHSNENFDQLAQRLGGDVAAMSPGAQQELRKHFEDVRKARDSMVNEEVEAGAQQIEDQIAGLRLIRGQMSGVSPQGLGSKLALISQDAAAGASKLQAGDIEEAAKIASKMGVPKISTSDPAAKQKLASTFQQVQQAAVNARSMAASGQLTSTEGRAWSDSLKQFQTSKQTELRTAAEATASARLSMQSMADQTKQLASQFENISVGDGFAEGSDHIEALTQHVNQVAQATAAARGGAAVSYSPMQASSILGSVAAASGVSGGDSLASTLMSERFQKSLAREIGSATAKASSRVSPARAVDAVRPNPVQNTTVINNNTTVEAPSTPRPETHSTPTPPPTPPAEPPSANPE